MELPALASLHNSHKHYTAYKSFRQLVILSGIAECLGLTVQTRQMDTALTFSNCDSTSLIILDVYDWIGINERMFANHKPDLQRAHGHLQKLQNLMAIGHANTTLRAKWECWYPYTLPCIAPWEQSELKRYPVLQWSWKEFGTQVNELHNLLVVVPSLPE